MIKQDLWSWEDCLLGSVLIGAVFVFDLFMPLGTAVPIFYIIPVLLASLRNSRTICVALAVVASLLTIGGYFFSPSGEVIQGRVNRILALVVIWGITWLSLSRAKSQEAQLESEAWFSGLVKMAPDAIVGIDEGQHIHLFNPGAETVFGYTSQEVMGKTLDLLLPGRVQEVHRGHIQSFVQSPDSGRAMGQSREVMARRKNGTEFPAEATISKFFQEGHTYCTVILRDMSEHKRAKEDLAQLNRQKELILASVGEGIYGVDSSGRTNFVNPAATHLLGWTTEDLIGQAQHDLIHHTRPNGTPYPQVDCLIYAAFRNGQVYHVDDEVFWRKDGTSFPVEYTSSPVRDEKGHLVGAVVAFRDLTDLKKTQEQANRLGRILDQSSNEIYLFNADSLCFIQVNQGARTQLGYSSEELSTLTPVDLNPECTRQEFDNLLRPLRTGSQLVLVYQTTHQRKNGSTYPVEVQLYLSQEEVAPVFVAIVQDITVRKQKEKEIRDLNASLEQRIVTRTAELSVAKDKAEESDRVKSAFLATMSHELRTPLNSIIGFTGVLLKELPGTLNAEQHKQLSLVQKSARHLLNLITDVLDISKIEAGQIEVAYQEFSLAQTIDGAMETIAVLAEKKGVRLRKTVDPQVSQMWSDPRRVEQILLNLLTNAVKFTAEGEVGLHCVRRAGWVDCGVSDTGLGIKPEDLPKLFHPFTQLQNGQLQEGTGLGLAITKRLVEKLGGTVSVESKWGAGSTFTVSLPIAHESEQTL